jgi:prepilin-type N-terminal cleavage/methylation domain-containing protein
MKVRTASRRVSTGTPRRTNRPAPSARSGFTLLELMVALVIGGMTISAAAALYLGLGSRADAIETTSRAVSHQANAERLLRILALNAEGRGDVPAVRGDGAGVTLETRCETPFGWSDACRVRLAFHAEGSVRRLVLRQAFAAAEAGGDSVEFVLRDSLRSGHFAYLIDAARGGSWSGSWTEGVQPSALAVIVDGDTLLLPLR